MFHFFALFTDLCRRHRRRRHRRRHCRGCPLCPCRRSCRRGGYSCRLRRRRRLTQISLMKPEATLGQSPEII